MDKTLTFTSTDQSYPGEFAPRRNLRLRKVVDLDARVVSVQTQGWVDGTYVDETRQFPLHVSATEAKVVAWHLQNNWKQVQ